MRSITKLDLQYAHRFYGFKGEAQYLHGHTGVLTIEVEDTVEPGVNMVFPCNEIQKTAWDVLKNFDHALILREDDPLLPAILKVYEEQGIKDGAPTNKMKGPAFQTELATAYPDCRLVVTKETMTVEGMIKIVYELLKDKLNIAKLTFTSGVNAASQEYKPEGTVDRCPLCGIALNEKGVCPKCGYSSIIAKGEVLDELRDLSGRVPFDEKGNPEISLDDISLVLLRDHLVKTGIRLACEQYGVDLVGGDTSASVTGLIISITCIGEGEEGKIVYRNGAADTNLICVTGDLGAAYMGLQLLEREREVGAGQKDFQPDFSGREYILERQLKPEARKDVIAMLKEAGVKPTAMMDVSDGLSSELLHICKQSNVGCRIYEDRIPIDYQTAIMAEEMNMNLVTAAMNGGEDYELLFTVPLTDHDKVVNMKGVRLIGRITKPELGAYMVTRDSNEIAIRAQGWNAFTQEDAN